MAFTTIRKEDKVPGGHRLSGADASTPRAKAFSRGNGPSAAAYLQEDPRIHCEPAPTACFPSSTLLPRLESRRKSMESLKKPRIESPRRTKQRGTSRPDRGTAGTNEQQQRSTPRTLLSMLCCRTFAVSHTLEELECRIPG